MKQKAQQIHTEPRAQHKLKVYIKLLDSYFD